MINQRGLNVLNLSDDIMEIERLFLDIEMIRTILDINLQFNSHQEHFFKPNINYLKYQTMEEILELKADLVVNNLLFTVVS